MNVSVLYDNAQDFFDESDKVQRVLGVYERIVSAGRSFTELSIPFAAGAKAVNQALAPLHIVRLALAPLNALNMAKSAMEVAIAPSYTKLIPLMQFLESSGYILEYFTVGVWIAQQMGAAGLEAVLASTTPVGCAAFGLQALGIGVLSWKIHEINAFWESVEKAETYEEKKKLLTEVPEDGIEKFKQRVFGVLTQENKETIKKIFEENTPTKIEQMLTCLKDYHFQKKVQAGISIALMIIGFVGIGLVTFAAAPVTPIAWGILGAVGVCSLALAVGSIYKKYSFEQALLQCLIQKNLTS